MPRRRKGTEYRPEICVLLRDAQPTYAEIACERDSRKRRERERACELAIDRLVKMYRDAKKADKLGQLDFRVCTFCEELKQRNHGQLPKAKGGRPAAEHRGLLIAMHLQEAIERSGEKYGSKEQAFKEIAARDDLFDQRRRSPQWATRYEYVKEIYYDSDPDFRRAVAVELELRRRKIHGEG